MNQLTINIAYISENQYLINKLISDLKTSEATFNLIDGSSFANGEDFYAPLVEDNHPCLLMISDNFLKSQSCLNRGLAYLQSLIKKEQVIPIIIDGTEIDASGNRQLIPTEFEKVSNVIKYMNYWQEKYLDLRKLKRSIPAEEEEEFLEKLKIVRSISSEVGEYLRNLRDTNYFAFSDFSANNYEAFFRVFGDESSYLKFAAKNNSPEDIIPSESSPIIAPPPKIITAVAEEISIEPTTKNEELPVVDTVTNDFLPFDNLVTEKEKIDKLSAEELASVDASTHMDNLEEGHIAPSNETEINSNTPIEKVDETEKEELIALDPEWRQLALEEEQMVELEDDETSLNDISASEERPLTETELLALELAQKLPVKENIDVSNQLVILEEEEEEEEEDNQICTGFC